VFRSSAPLYDRTNSACMLDLLQHGGEVAGHLGFRHVELRHNPMIPPVRPPNLPATDRESPAWTASRSPLIMNELDGNWLGLVNFVFAVSRISTGPTSPP
jgi:hypothetical protein